MHTLVPLLAVLLAYLLGSVSFAVVVSRAMGLADPRSYGSGNPGATNVLRTGNRGAAVLTLIGDAAKGWVALALAQWLAAPLGLDAWALAGVALAVFLGHLAPVFFRFQGGKGVATAAGILLAISPVLGGATILTWLLIAFFFRFSSLAALVSAVFAPLYHVFLFGPNPMAAAVLLMSVLLVWRHRGNIAKLLSGEESRIGAARPAVKGAGKDAKGAARGGANGSANESGARGRERA